MAAKITRLTHKIAIQLHLVERAVPFAASPETFGYTRVYAVYPRIIKYLTLIKMSNM